MSTRTTLADVRMVTLGVEAAMRLSPSWRSTLRNRARTPAEQTQSVQLVRVLAIQIHPPMEQHSICAIRLAAKRDWQTSRVSKQGTWRTIATHCPPGACLWSCIS